MQANFMEFIIAVTLMFQLLTACQGLDPCGNEVTITPASQIVKLHTNASISCRGSADAVFQWYRLPVNASIPLTVFFNDHYRQGMPSQNGEQYLVIVNVTAEDAGKYFCEKVNPPPCGSDYSTITIFKNVSITVTPKQYRRLVGETLNLTVAVDGNPLPTAVTLQKWSTGAFVDYPSTRYSVNDLRTISIPNLFLNDSGRYRVCVESSHDSESVCDEFDIEITDLPVIDPIHPIAVKDGGSFSVICRVIHSFDSNYRITWQTANGTELSSSHHPLGRVTQVNTNELELHVETVTKAIDYLCVVKNYSRELATEYVHVYLSDVPSPPRDLKIQITGTNGLILITWTAPETDNGSPLTSYYINITAEGGDSMTVRIIPDMTSFPYFAGCSVINVTTISENLFGNSSAINASISTKDLCVSDATGAPAASSESGDIMLPTIGAGIAVIFIFVVLTLFAIIIFVIWWNKQKREIKQLPSAINVEALQANNNTKVNSLKMVVATTPPPLIKRTTSIRRYRGMLEVSRDNIMLRDVLYDNAYYELRKGLITVPENENKTHEVMVKKAKHSAPMEEEHNIQEEIKMMSNVGIHENVVGLLRACTAEAPAYLITEYFAHGDLLGFLRASRGHYGMYTVSPGTGCKTHMCAVQGQDLLKMATQVAAGMKYLAEKKITHRSLCTRNVLVGTGLQVKVYNYGPKPDSEAIPHKYVKWMSPETLFDGTANTMSDVWSFGVTLWEIITIGGAPYATTHPEQMRELLHTGHRLPKPDHCADALYIIMERSWVVDPSRRPTFSELHKQLDDICRSKLSYLNTSLYNDEEYSQFEETHKLMTAL